ncbi:hypothetical protein M23134_05417 [Microscilla marina ATCC 23134]|uniref:Uncharacterized protein n=1 Tax=Microscilla marina ATCC 23134 TaxID=313606 RepID=A1ZHS7_MICM2|nr:hypothetical protein M23134_05417 [Microscilla marina ATCC 23134]
MFMHFMGWFPVFFIFWSNALQRSHAGNKVNINELIQITAPK